MLEAFALEKVSGRVRAAGIVASLVAILAIGGLAVAGADISVGSLQIGLVEGPSQVDRTTLGFDKGIVGDTVRVSARVANDGTDAVGEFEVDFFFTETISGEHGRLGTQVVSGLEPGEEKRPVVLFDTSALLPGIYAFSAEVDPRNALGDTEPCDNAAPRGPCGTTAAESADKYTLILLREGRHISQLRVGNVFPTCRMGDLQKTLAVNVYNVGTEPISGSDLVIYGYYRLSLTAPANEFAPLVTDASGNPAQLTKIVSLGDPGPAGYILITINYDVFSHLFRPSSVDVRDDQDGGHVLGRANPVQIRITVQPADGSGTPQDIFLPAQFELSQFYSTVDLWTFPARSSCCSEGCTTMTSVQVEPAVAGGLVFHVAKDASGETLHVLKVRTGEEKATWSAPTGQTLTGPVATYDATTKTYRVFVGASDGRVYALEGTDKEEDSFLANLWSNTVTKASNSEDNNLVKGDTHLVLSADGTKLIVGSENGAFVLDAANGKTLRTVTKHGAVTSAPAYVDATGALWIATDRIVRGILPNESECTYDLKVHVTTDLLKNQRESALFFGTQSGFLYAVDLVVKSGACTQFAETDPLASVVGMSLVSADDDAVIYLASDTGEMVRVKYNHGQGFRNATASTRALDPKGVVTGPALLPNAAGSDAAAIFISGQTKTTQPVLQAWDPDLGKHATVEVWGVKVPFLFKPEEGGTAPAFLLRPIVDPETFTLLVASSDGHLYAFDLSQFE